MLYPKTILDKSVASHLPQVGFRKRTRGPEDSLVDWILAVMPFNSPSGHKATVFREPRIKSAFPDLVIAWWKSGQATKRNELLEVLSHDELRLLQYFATHSCRSIVFEELGNLGVRSLKSRLQKMEKAGIIRSTKIGGWMLSGKLDDVFAVRKIIAIEAKMQPCERLFEQAVVNRWFSCESYVMLPKKPREDVIERAKKLGVGIITQENGKLLRPKRPPGRSTWPKSYGAWLVNQWVVTAIHETRII